MRRLSTVVLVMLVACTDGPGSPTEPSNSGPTFARAGAGPQVPLFKPGIVVARFVDPSEAAQIAADRGAQPVRALRRGGHVLRVPEGREQALVRALSNHPRVVYAELSLPRYLSIPCRVGDGDCLAPSDGFFGSRWDLHNDGAVRDAAGNILESVGLVPDADMDWLEAFDQLGSFTGSAVVGVVDTGIFGTHEDLSGRLVAQRDHFNADDFAEDDNGHGTHVSGIALARGDNGLGATGVAYGPNLGLVVSKGCGLVFLFGYICWSEDIADGITWAVDNGANVINLSLGGDQGSAVEQQALQYALANDVLPICAAGNDQSAVDFPGAFPECMAVSSTDWADQIASYSSSGPEVEVSAPGGDTIHAAAYDRIASTWNDGSYVYLAGTSMAAPQVTGLAALLHALGVTSAEEKRQIIRTTADDLGQVGPDPQYGDGRINVWNAVLTALGTPPPPPPPNEPPVASFSYDCTDLSCVFTDTSTDPVGTVVSWSWDFGDGSGSSVQDPSYSFSSGGAYTVTLTVTDNGGLSDTTQQTVTVTDPPPPPPNEPPVAGFTSDCTDLSCVFTDASTDPVGTIASWSWDFGDGSTSSAQSPSRTYAAAGDYTVTLTVTDDGGLSDATQQMITATDPPPPPPNQAPTAGFSYSCDELTCVFTDTSTDPDGGLTSWNWDFGDGASTNAQNVTHVYSAGGTYTVTLTVTDDGGLSDATQQTITVDDPPPPPPNEAPTAGFSYSCDVLTCVFTDTSTDPEGGLTSWNWDFGDTSGTNAQNVTHVYSAGGTYTVTLTVTDAGGLSDATQQTITVDDPPPPPPNEAPTAGFSYSCDVLTCVFTDTSTDPEGGLTSWNWDFGDTSGTNAQNVTHVYSTGGTYTVTLTVTDAGGLSDATQQTITVDDPPPPPPNEAPTAGFSYSCDGLTCSFTDTSTDPEGSLAGWNWDFGDGASTNAQNVTHVYSMGGTYTVTLTVTDAGGLSDTTQQTVTVTDLPNQAPTAGFSYSCDELTCVFSDTSTDPDGGLTSWNWDFGDGASTNAQNVTHVYSAGGTYTVTLTVTDDGGLSDATQQTVTVDDPPPPPPNQAPTAGFTYSCDVLTCVFTDTSTDPEGGLTSWNWDFGDTSGTNAQNVTHVYSAGGTYTVTLTVTDAGGLSDATQQTITVDDPPPPPPNQAPTAGFTYSCDVLTCVFTDTSTDPEGGLTSWNWDFGDTSGTNAQNVTHVYSTGGTYTVTLTVTDAGGLSDATQQTITVDDPPPPPPNEAPTAGFSYSCDGLTCSFTDTSTDPEGSLAGWNWDFGDGASTNAQNATHVYSVGGTYTVTLTVTDDGGLSDTTQQTVTVASTPSGGLTLTASGSKVRGRNVVDLSWSGTSVPVDIYRDGSIIDTVSGTPATYQDSTGQRGSASYTYLVCEAGTTVCTNEVTVEF